MVRVHANIVAVKGNKYCVFRMCVCSSRYPSCNTHAPYCRLWPVRLYCIFPQCLTYGTIFGETLRNTECVFWLSLQLLSETFLLLRSTERDMIKNVYWSPCEVLMKLEFSRHICEKYSNIKFHENPSSCSRDVPCGQTDRHNEANSRFSQFCESA